MDQITIICNVNDQTYSDEPTLISLPLFLIFCPTSPLSLASFLQLSFHRPIIHNLLGTKGLVTHR